jgi:hypothetical protein
MNEYDKQADDFLLKTETTFKAVKIAYEKYFGEDDEKRDIYKIVLKRGNQSWVLKFGQSLHDTHKMIKPSAYDVLACIVKQDPGSFHDFCSEYGYNEDSKKAEKIYQAVVEEYKNVMDMFGDVIDELREIQ